MRRKWGTVIWGSNTTYVARNRDRTHSVLLTRKVVNIKSRKESSLKMGSRRFMGTRDNTEFRYSSIIYLAFYDVPLHLQYHNLVLTFLPRISKTWSLFLIQQNTPDKQQTLYSTMLASDPKFSIWNSQRIWLCSNSVPCRFHSCIRIPREGFRYTILAKDKTCT